MNSSLLSPVSPCARCEIPAIMGTMPHSKLSVSIVGTEEWRSEFWARSNNNWGSKTATSSDRPARGRAVLGRGSDYNYGMKRQWLNEERPVCRCKVSPGSHSLSFMSGPSSEMGSFAEWGLNGWMTAASRSLSRVQAVSCPSPACRQTLKGLSNLPPLLNYNDNVGEPGD